MATKYINFTSEFEQDVQDELALKRKKNNELTTRTYYKILRLMLHDQLKDSSRPNDSNKKGCVIAFSNKKAMVAKKAEIVTSLQRLVKMQPTHFSQGSYPHFKLHVDKKGVVSGFQKDNLNQINFCLVDIDDQKKTVDEIVNCAEIYGLCPSLIVQTDKGWQVYFVFTEALYLNGKKFKWILNAAEQVNENIKKIYKNNGFNVDMGCTTFQICRFPQKERIGFYDIDNLMSFDEYAKWSLKRSEYSRLTGDKNINTSTGMSLIKGDIPGWARALLGFGSFEKGDRNTALYTVSLSFKDSGFPIEQAQQELTNWMGAQGLDSTEIKRTVESAYKHDKHAQKAYFEPLLEKYGLDVQKTGQIDWSKFTEKQLKRYWSARKPAKARQERKNSHYSEWMADIMELIEENGCLEITKAELLRKLGINRNNHGTLNIVLKKLVDEGKIELTKGTSRKAPLIIKKKAGTPEQSVGKTEKPERTGKYGKQELVEDVARSFVGRVAGRELARVRAVKFVGVQKYQQLVTAFITDPENFVGGKEVLDRVRNNGNDELASG